MAGRLPGVLVRLGFGSVRAVILAGIMAYPSTASPHTRGRLTPMMVRAFAAGRRYQLSPPGSTRCTARARPRC